MVTVLAVMALLFGPAGRPPRARRRAAAAAAAAAAAVAVPRHGSGRGRAKSSLPSWLAVSAATSMDWRALALIPADDSAVVVAAAARARIATGESIGIWGNIRCTGEEATCALEKPSRRN